MTSALSPAVAERTCGSCNVCCVALTIDDPALKKIQGIRCPNARPDNSCGIYHTRPQTCRTFLCGWRQLRWVHPALRPDSSGVLVRHHVVAAPGCEEEEVVVFTLLNRAALQAEGLAESVAAAVGACLPVYLEIPGPPGYTSGVAMVNDVLADAVIRRDKAAMVRVLGRAYAKGLKGRGKRIAFAPAKRA